jgi:radical SAM superfamily enzyme YgiQ (UPF0313 family)
MSPEKTRVLILTGFTPINLSQLDAMGITSEAIPLLLSLMGRDTFRFSVPQMGPAALGSYLGQHGIEVVIEDFYYDEINAAGFDIVGISSTFLEFEDAAKIAGLVRQQNPSAVLVMGGPLGWLLPPAVLLPRLPGVDYIVQREGEDTFLSLIDAITGNGDPRTVEGIAFRDKESGQVIETPPRKPVDIEALPWPAWELMGIPSPKRLPVLPVETSRGCPYHCAYCSEVTYWSRPVRYRSRERVVAELLHNVQSYGINTFRFTDSCFTAPPERCGGLCDAIYEGCINNGTPLKWSAYSRIENLTPALLEGMKRAGCVALDIGLESGAPEVLRRMGKNFDPEIAVTIARAARGAGIMVNYNIMVGFPGETRDTLQTTIDLVERAAPDTFACFGFILKPNTRIFDQRDRFGIEGAGLKWKHATMTSDEIKPAQLRIAREITSATAFPGGEHFTCYLASLGYSPGEIRMLFKAVSRLVKNPGDEATLQMLKAATMKMASYS